MSLFLLVFIPPYPTPNIFTHLHIILKDIVSTQYVNPGPVHFIQIYVHGIHGNCFRDDESLKDWRVKTKKIQQKKQYESMIKGTKGDNTNLL